MEEHLVLQIVEKKDEDEFYAKMILYELFEEY